MLREITTTQDLIDYEQEFYNSVSEHSRNDHFFPEWERTLSAKYMQWLERVVAT